ncbi:MAG: nuclear transport factor 2 family protein [Sideroxydans sp.]|nr:nuclear transport factor 2 family protein [Sideroxydans sp.]
MITKEWAQHFAIDWVDSWNTHDLDRVLSHYTDDFEMSSPFIVAFSGEASGTLKGKAQVGAYWRAALQRIPDLHFELIQVFVCVNSITIYYKAVLGKLATEVFIFNPDGKAFKALAHYDN